jgi:hypothetical protein
MEFADDLIVQLPRVENYDFTKKLLYMTEGHLLGSSLNFIVKKHLRLFPYMRLRYDPCRDLISKGQGKLVVNSVRESVKRGLERVKLKNLHC